jgi:hypothetical protein
LPLISLEGNEDRPRVLVHRSPVVYVEFENLHDELMKDLTLEELWDGEGTEETTECFDPSQLVGLPELARRYLTHAIEPGALIARAVLLEMHGEINLNRHWCPFTADQVIRWDRGFIWRARVKMKAGIVVTGSDRWIDGQGAMLWKLLGLLPIVKSDGPDISRSALGRAQIEVVWLPTVLVGPNVVWEAKKTGRRLGVDLRFADRPGHLDVSLGRDGQLQSASLLRWGDPPPNPGTFDEHPFGATASSEKTFDGITIPTEIRVGWYFGSERFEKEGEFFRVTVTNARYR